MLDWSNYIHADETVLWQGRPAPRCFTFRHWRRALFGWVLLAVCSWWQFVGWTFAEQGRSVLWALLPLPFLLIACYVAVGQILRARLEWERVFYALTSKQIIVQCGVLKTRIITLPIGELNYQCLYPLGEHLGNLYLEFGSRRITLCCVEYPQELYQLLEPIVNANNSAVN
jgi:hypothetical protein